MQLLSFDRQTAHAVVEYDSVGFFLARVARLQGTASVIVAYLAPGGVIGRHPATQDQLLVVVEGTGTVAGGDNRPVPIRQGQAAFWHAGEQHETRTESGLTAVIIEGGGLQLPADTL